MTSLAGTCTIRKAEKTNRRRMLHDGSHGQPGKGSFVFRNTHLLALLLAAAAPCGLRDAQAQAGAAAPGRIEQDIKAVPEPARRSAIRIDTPRFPEQVPTGAQEVKFVLGAVAIVGNQVLSPQVLASAWEGRVGKEISLADAFGIAAAVSAKYRDSGYILSQAVVMAQDLSTTGPATLRIRALEGYVDKVSFRGIEADKLLPYLAAVQAERPLKLETLERCLLLLSELAGVSAQATIKAGSTPNSADLEILVARDPAAFSVSAHNRSAPSQGKFRIEASVDFRGVLSEFDRHDLRWVSSGDKKLNLLSYGGEAPLGSNGLKAQVSASASRSTPDTDLPAALGSIDTRSDNFSVGLSYPLIRSRQRSLGVRATLGGYNNLSETAGFITSRDRIRALRVGFTGDYADDFGGINLLDVEASKGLTGRGASPADDPYLNGTNPHFTKVTLYAARLQSLGGEWSALLAATGQFAGKSRLPSAEQFGLGGDTFLRAYDPSEAIGETGAAAKLEVRYNFAINAVASTVYVYADGGQATRKQSNGADVDYKLAAAGLGIRLSGPHRSRGYVEVAKPIKKDVISQGNQDPRLFGGIGIDF